MIISKDVLIDTIETVFSLLPEVPGKLDWLNIPGVRGRVTPFSHPFANVVSAATLDSDNADATIKQVIEFFTKGQKAFSWVVGPRSTPADLGNRLVTAGLTKTMEIAGMTLTDLRIPIRVNPSVKIREATTPDERLTTSIMMARAFPFPEEIARHMGEVFSQVRDKVKTRMYLAFLDGIAEPVATCTTLYIPNRPIVRMSGAATLEEYRGKGIYTAMTARRLADAYKDGAKAAIIEAKLATSASACRKLGFREICSLELYTWAPESEKK